MSYDYILHYYVCGCELICEVVNYYRSLQLLVYYHLSIVFMYSCPVCWIIEDLMGWCVPFRRRPFIFNAFELVRFRYPVSPYSFPCSTIKFSISFSY